MDVPKHDPATDPSLQELLAARPQLRLHAMDGLLLEDVPLAAIADAVGTPCWVYGAATMRRRARSLREAFDAAGLDVALHYAVKANDHLAVLQLMHMEGLGADVVSAGELLRARRTGVAPDEIVFSGVGKTDEELRLALSQKIGQINVESAEELLALSRVASETGQTARVAIRVNPDIDAGTHDKISTGRSGDKFGVAHDEVVALYVRAASLPGITPIGLAVHIGSQISTTAPYRAAFSCVARLVGEIRAAGHTVEVVDCGGGLGIAYRDEPEGSPRALAGVIAATLGSLGVRLMLEPGRWLVGPAGVLLASVVRGKQAGPDARFVVLDAGMNDLVRPAMYEAWHGIVPVAAVDATSATTPADVVGPVCESADCFARRRALPQLETGALVAILDAGAYGATMSSGYNARPQAAAVMVENGTFTVILPRASIESLWAREILPERRTATPRQVSEAQR